jgi:hypothetical protein
MLVRNGVRSGVQQSGGRIPGERVAPDASDGHRVILRVNLSRPSRKDCTNDRHGQYRPRLLEEQAAQASPDLLRELPTTFINTPMSAEADAVRGAAYGTEDRRVAATEAAHADEAAGAKHRGLDYRRGP